MSLPEPVKLVSDIQIMHHGRQLITVVSGHLVLEDLLKGLWRVYHHGIYAGYLILVSLSLAIPLWVAAICTGDGFGHRWGRNGEFCVVQQALWAVGLASVFVIAVVD